MMLFEAARIVTALAAIHGTVRAAGHGPPLGGVSIVVDGTPRTRTDSTGGYALDSLAAGPHEFRFSRVGYDARRVTILLADGSDLALDIELTPHPITLPPIEVIATTRPDREPIGPRPDDGWSEDGDYRFGTDWQLRHPATALDLNAALATVPGITTRSDNAMTVSIHGGRGSENLILLDGIPLVGAVHFAGASSAITPEAIARLDVHTGIAPARFGDALAGVIEVESVDALPIRGSTSLALTATDLRGTMRAQIGTTGSVLVAARSSFRNVLSDDGGVGFDNGYQDAMVTGHLPVGRGVMRLVAFGNANRLGWRTTAPSDDGTGSAEDGSSLHDRAEWRSGAIGTTWETPVGRDQRWQTSAWWNGTDATITLAATARLESRLSRLGLRSEWQRTGPAATLHLGAEVSHPSSRYALQSSDHTVFHNAPTLGALYGEWRTTDMSPWSLSFGGRVVSDFVDLLAFDPRIVVSRALGRQARLSVGFGRSHQAVQSLLNEDNIGSAVIGPTLPLAAGRDLPIARAEQWTATVEQAVGHHGRIRVAGYRRDWHDVLTPATTGGGLFAAAPEVGSGDAEGVLATVAADWGRFALQATTGLGRATQRSGAFTYPTGAARPWLFDGSLGYHAGSTTDVQLRWTTGAGQDRSAIASGIEWQPYHPGTGSGEFEGTPTNLPGAINALRLASPLRIDLGVRRSWTFGSGPGRHPAFTTAVRIHNLLDRANPIGVMAMPGGGYQWLQGTPRGLIAEVGWRY